MAFELPRNTQRVTKEFLLSKNTQETYMEHYLGVPVKKGLFISPSNLRSDNKPTCAFYKNDKGVLLFKDFAGITGDFIKVVMEIFNCSYHVALTTIANDFGYIKTKNYEIHPPKIEYSGIDFKETTDTIIQNEIVPFSKKDLDWWEDFGVSIEELKLFKVFAVKNVFLNGYLFSSSSIKVPIYGYYGGKKDGKELWRNYFPTKTNYRFLSNWTNKCIQGLKQLPKEGDLLVITKSLKDVMALRANGIYAIAPTSETVILDNNQMSKLKERFKKIILVGDNDLPGVKSLNKWKKKYPELKVLFLRRKFSKDISDLIKSSKLEGFRACEELKDINNIELSKYFYKF